MTPQVQATEPQAPQPPAAEKTTPREAREIIDKLMSPYCPGLSLSACPSPSADSLRSVIIAEVRAGAPKDSVLNRLYAEFGSAIRGAPEFSGMGIVAWVVPGLFVVTFGVLVTRWLRAQSLKAKSAQRGVTAIRPRVGVPALTNDEFTDAELSRLQRLLQDDNPHNTTGVGV